MHSLLKKSLPVLFCFLVLPVSCNKNNKEEVESVQLTETEEEKLDEPVPIPQIKVPEFKRTLSNLNFDKNIDEDLYFDEVYPYDEYAGCYIKPKKGITAKMYSLAGYDDQEHFVDYFKEGQLGVLLYVYFFTDSEAACTSWLKIYNLENNKEGWVLYHPVYHKDFLFTSKTIDQFEKNTEYEIQNINAKITISIEEADEKDVELSEDDDEMKGKKEFRPDVFKFSFDPFSYDNEYSLETVYNNDSDYPYIVTYDREGKRICFYSDSGNLLHAFRPVYSYRKIVYDADKLYCFRSNCDKDANYIVDIFTVKIEQKKNQFPLVYDYDSDIAVFCRERMCFYENRECSLWVKFSAQGMYALFSIDPSSGESLAILRGQYRFLDRQTAELYQAGDNDIYIAEPERIKKLFNDIPLFGGKESPDTVRIYVNTDDIYNLHAWTDCFNK